MIKVIDVCRSIPDMGTDYNEASGWAITDTHFSDDDIQAFIDEASITQTDELKIKYYAAYYAITTWIKDLKLNDVAIKQNSLSVGLTGVANEKLLDNLLAAKADLEAKIEVEPYFGITFTNDESIGA
jgi:hypothetical protein